MSFAKLVLFVDGVGYSLAARSRDEMFIKKQCILWYLLLKIIFRLFKDMLQLYHLFLLRILQQIGERSAEMFQIYSLIFLKKSLCTYSR